MLNNRFRSQANEITKEVGKRIPIDPNIMTLIGLFVSIFAGVLFASGNLVAGAIFILLSGVCDVIDGAIARSQHSETRFGGFLDSTCDRFADAAIIIGLLYSGYANPIIAALAIHSSLTVSYVRARAENENVECSVGIAERAERLLIIVVGAIIAGLSDEPHDIMFLALALMIILSYITVFQRIYHTAVNLGSRRL